MKKKMVYITSAVSPHQVKLSNHLQKYYDAEFWFYESLGARPSWWNIDLPKHCIILDDVLFKKNDKYYSKGLITKLREAKPDIIILGGFFIPSNYIAYLWAKKNNIKVIVFTETFRSNGVLRKRDIYSIFLSFLYMGLDSVFSCHEEANLQMKELLPLLKNKVHTVYYAADIDSYFNHPVRFKKDGYTYLFPNRLIDIYNPLLAIEIFAEIVDKYPLSILKMNSEGELKKDSISLIKKLGIEKSVHFLGSIKSWEDLPEVYKNSDILLFPAKFSNGNFTINEAMASGMGIVISNKIKGNTRWLKGMNSSYICEPNKNSFLEGIDNYIKNPDNFIKHANINRKLVWKQSGEAVAKRYFDILG